MQIFKCDSCGHEIASNPMILKVEAVHTGAQIRKPIHLCIECEREVHFAIGNAILSLKS